MSAAQGAPAWRDREDPPGEHVAVTRHARLATLARVSPTEPHPAARLRRLWDRSEPAPRADARDVEIRGERFRIVFDEVDGEGVALLTIYPVDREGRA